jgi:predicted GH43/DUF377 family glycosyl hydrolase/DNA-binding CsgD family transcriptional regulator
METPEPEKIPRASLRPSRHFDEIAANELPTSRLVQQTQTVALEPREHESVPRDARGCLSARERDVLSLVAEGLSNQEIGATLGITLETVKTHVQNVLHRLGAHNRAHAVFFACQHGLITSTGFASPPQQAAVPDALARPALGADAPGHDGQPPAAGGRPAASNGLVDDLRGAPAGRDVTVRAQKYLITSTRRSRQEEAVKATRLADQPVVAAGSVPGYGPIFNAGVIHHDGSYHLFARAIRDGYRRNPKTGPHEPRFLDYISDLLVFTSPDGLDYRFQKLLHQSSPAAVYEDPRVQVVRSAGQPHFLLSYTNVPSYASGKPWRAAISELTYCDGAFSLGRELLVGLEHIPNKDVVLCNLNDERIALIQRLEHRASPKQSIQLATFDTLEDLWEFTPDHWHRYTTTFTDHVILTPSPSAAGIGAAAPPLRVDDELVFFYHERDETNVYTARAALLDCDTGRLRATLPYPILTPELPWELHGDVDNVVFVQGAHLRDDGTIYLTYGAADRHVGAASIDKNALLAALHRAEAHTAPTRSAVAA